MAQHDGLGDRAHPPSHVCCPSCAENGLIKLVRESLNVVAAPRPSLPGASRTARSGERDLLASPGLPELRRDSELRIERDRGER